jgi:flagellar hook-length control protein FliK
VFGKEVRVVIQITPQTELANSLTGEARPPGEESSGIREAREQGGESPHKTKAGKSQLGVFAQILSGLRKTGAGVKATGEIKPDAPGKTSESDVLRSVQKSKNKIGKGLSKAEKSGETEPEFELQLQAARLSAQEKNTLLTAGYLAGEFTDENSELADKGLTADSVVSLGRPNGGEATEAETDRIDKAGLEGGKQSETVAVTTGELGKDLKLSNSPEKNAEKAKNRSEIGPRVETTAAQIRGGVQQQEAKKTVLGEKEGRNRLDEARNKDKRRGAAIEVRDFRSQGAELSQKDSSFQVKAVAESRTGEGSVREITLELRLPNQGQESQSAPVSWETKAGQAFEDILARELHQNLNNDIVRHASIILRDSSEGTIRLALKPESLGNVKIRLEMAENKITGRIVVESEETLHAFEKEITSLEKAFVESGFEGANLEMSLAADSGGAGQWQGTEASQSLMRLIAASHYEAASAEWTEMPAAFDFYHGTRSVNVLA